MSLLSWMNPGAAGGQQLFSNFEQIPDAADDVEHGLNGPPQDTPTRLYQNGSSWDAPQAVLVSLDDPGDEPIWRQNSEGFSRAYSGDQGSTGTADTTSAEAVIRQLTPGCSSAIFTRVRREGINSAADLASLDKDDLKMLGFSMVERSRVLRWGCGDLKLEQLRTEKTDAQSLRRRLERGGDEEKVQQRLDEVEKQADFWVDLLSASALAPYEQRNARADEQPDVRENMLEMLFDLTEEHVKEVYNGIDRDADGHISAAELGKGLQRYNLPELNEKALARILDVVTASKSRFLQLPEFEAVLSRLKLAQVLLGAEASMTLGAPRKLEVADYSASSATANIYTVSRPREFFFGHRPKPTAGGTLVRWVHLDGLDLTMLLALTVKYSLHPLSVEDVLEQSPTKIDRNGRNYFVAIEHLSLSGASDGSEPVRVRGRHVTCFCAGPPRLDTMVTVAQPDKSFEEEWPGGVSYFDIMNDGDRWVQRLQERLRAPLSRLRERLADFLLYQAIDLCTDELVAVTRAYTKRLGHLERELSEKGSMLPQDWPSEVSLARLQLAVLARRVRGLQRVIRHIIHDSDLSAGMLSYFQDVADHLNEAHDDALQIMERCTAIAENYERTLERGQELVQQMTAERLNRTLFMLTGLTGIFAPMQFITGVYGMNFWNTKAGKASMPELVADNGYMYFWTGVISYFILMSLFFYCSFRRLKTAEAKAKGQCHGPLHLCGTGHLSSSDNMSPRGGDRDMDPMRKSRTSRNSTCNLM